jgi:hypothetical protein
VRRLTNVLLAAAVGVLFVLALAVHGVVAGVLLVVVAGLLATLSAATWSAIPARGRPLRVLVIALVLVLAAVKLAGAR